MEKDTRYVSLEQMIDARLSRIEEQNSQIIMALQKKKKGIIFGLEEENIERGNWTGRFDFFLSCLGYAVGLGNVWRFPYLCYKNGGGAFFIPYVIFLVLVGMPIFFLELSLGQFCSSGPLTCWKYAPFFQGIGLGMVVVSSLVAIYYNMIIGWSLYYLFASFTSELPWEKCRPEWSTPLCIDFVKIFTDKRSCMTEQWDVYDNGTCYNINGTLVALWNQTLAKENKIERTLPSEEYFERRVVGSAYSKGIQDLGPMRWEIVLCYLLAFILVILALSKSIKSSGKVVYFTATFPYVVLIILLIRGLLLDGHKEGIEFYITPKVERLKDSLIWKDAAVQIFFSLSASWGGLIALASYNRFHNDALRDSISVSIGNCATSVFGGFVIFSFLGSLSKELGVPVDEVAKSGPSLAFIVYPYAVTKLPAAPFWSIIFFLMLLTLGVDSQFVLVETVTTSLMDRFTQLRNYKFLTVLSLCVFFFLLGLTLTTNGGIYMLELMDTYSGGWNIMFIALCECVSISYFYGIRRFLLDIECMIGNQICGCMPFWLTKYWWALCWCVLTPIGVLFIMIFSWVKYTDMEGEAFPEWADVLGWLMTLTVVVAIIAGMIFTVLTSDGDDLAQKYREAIKPSVEWGPALTMHREEVARYTPGFVVDPWSTVEPTKPPLLDDEVALHVSRSYSVMPEYKAQSAPRLTADSGVVSQPGDILFMMTWTNSPKNVTRIPTTDMRRRLSSPTSS